MPQEYNPMRLYKKCWPVVGLYTKKFFNGIYTQKAAPGLHKSENRRLKKIYFAFAAKNGVIHEALQSVGIRGPKNGIKWTCS